jgi:PEGA domain-containing protein
MSVPPISVPASLSTSGYEDGLGLRTLMFDRETGGILERLQLRPEFGAFERAIRERIDLGAAFDDERFAHTRGLERDPSSGAVVIVSEFVPGNRLLDVLEGISAQGSDEAAPPGVDAALGFLLEVLPALATLHTSTGFTHGAVGPGRIVVTPAGQVVLLDWIFAHTLERLQLDRRRLWRQFGIAMPSGVAVGRFDAAADVAQAALAAVMIVIGRPLRAGEFPDGLAAAAAEVVEIAQITGSARFATGLQRFLHRALPMPGSRLFSTAEEAGAAVRQLAGDIGVSRCRTALAAYVSEFNGMRGSEFSEDDEDRPLYSSDPILDTDESTAETGEDAGSTRSASASMEFEIELDSEAETAATGSDPLSYEISLDSESGREFIVDAVLDADLAAPVPSFEEPAQSYEIHSEEGAAAQPSVAAEPFVFEEAAPIDSAAPDPEPPYTERVDTGIVSESVYTEGADTGVTSEPLHTETADAPVVSFDVQEFESYTPAAADVSAGTVFPAAEEEDPPSIASVPEVPVARPVAQPVAAPTPRQRRRGAKRDRDKLRSNAKPAPAPPPPPPAPVPAPSVAQPVPQPVPRPAAPMPYYPPMFDPREPAAPAAPAWTFATPPAPAAVPAPAPTAIRVKQAPATATVRIKNDAPAGYAPARRLSGHEQGPVSTSSYVDRTPSPRVTSLQWKLGAVAALILAVGAGAVARPYLMDRPKSPVVVATQVAPAPEKTPPVPLGSLALITEPAGAHVLLDGAPAGDTPLTIESVAPGRHTVTFVTASGTVKKTVRVEAGKTASLDIPVYSGWVAVFAPIPLDVTESGRSIGTTEQGRLMLSPGRHQLTFSNRDLGYSSSEAVDIVPGEERSVNVEPTGEISLNALPWAEIWIDGRKAGDTPIANLKVPLGTHEIIFRHPQFGDRKVTATVHANTPAAATVDFTKAQ